MMALVCTPLQLSLTPVRNFHLAKRAGGLCYDQPLVLLLRRESQRSPSCQAQFLRKKGKRRPGAGGRIRHDSNAPSTSAPKDESPAPDPVPDPPASPVATQEAVKPSSPPLKTSGIGTFRGGQKRAEVQLPSLLLRLTCDEVLEDDGEYTRMVDTAIAGGVTILQLDVGTGDPGGARLFEAACVLKELLRGRAQLLIAERADIAAAVGADGVLLSDKGLPAVVARRMMENAGSMEGAVLPLVARSVKSADAALAATAAEGADLLLLEDQQGGQWSASDLSGKVSIPIICEAPAPSLYPNWPQSLEGLQDGASGLALQAAEVSRCLGPFDGDARSYAAALQAALRSALLEPEGDGVSSRDSPPEEAGRAAAGVVAPPREAPSRRVLEQEARQLVDKERSLLADFLQLLRAASPQMVELSLLEDAVARLDDLFLLVIVGEFNSGKSSVVNALLGGRFLKEGVVPTTNEITLLRFSDDERGQERAERHPDGHFVRFLPAHLLKHMNLVDTPGTNVILERQQLLTEEFVPRADLVVFVLSADRPLTESEVSFLRYIREWGKKVVFLLNKADLLTEAEVEEVMRFVSSNVRRLLGVDAVQIFPVSARSAMSAKLAAGQGTSWGNGSLDSARLAQDVRWQTSGFHDLESFIFGFLEGSTDAGAERLRLKLDTPLGVAAALVAAAQRQLAGEAQQAANDARSLQALEEQVAVQRQAMEQEAVRLRRRAAVVVEAAAQRAEQFVDSTLQLRNVQILGQYLLTTDVSRGRATLPGGRRFEAQVVGSAVTDLRKLLYEHRAWLVSSATQQLQAHCELAAARWPHLADRCGVDVPELGVPGAGQPSSMEALEEFDTRAAALVLDEELRQAVVDLCSGFGAAGVSASVLTAVLPTTVEDLLALALCTLGGYSGALKLPPRRAEVNAKVRRAADSLAARLAGSMEGELEATLERAEAALAVALAPYREAVAAETQRVAELQARSELLTAQLRALRQQVQNIGC